jgi:hypothetical protein
LSAAEDIDTTNGTATIRISASEITNKDVTATESDNDPPTPCYTIDPNASYSYVYGNNQIISWQDNSDDGYFDLNLGDFDFRFYGTLVTNLRISTNGYITSGTEGTDYSNDPIPNENSPNAIIALFWDNLDLGGITGEGGVWWSIFGTTPNRQLIIEWRQVPSHEFGTEMYSFELILYESTDRIKFQYLDVDSGTPHDLGVRATIGIENLDGTEGAQYSFNGSTPLSNGLAIEFIPTNNIFSDIPYRYWAEDYITAIYNIEITIGCTQDDPNTPENERRYCPEDSVTRGQMAAFIIRAKYGEDFSYTTTPYFTDVPSTHTFFKYVQKMKDEGLTVVSGIYMVDEPVTRGQMAAFIIRAKYGENFSYTQTPYFNDVPSTHNFFKYVQKMKDEGITAVTGNYGVDNIVNRAQMAAFLARAFLGME